MQILDGRTAPIDSIVFSPCGRWLAAGGFGGADLWDTANPTAMPKELPLCWNLAFRPNGELFYGQLSHTNTTCEWFLVDPEQFKPRSVGEQFRALVMAPDGEWFIGVGQQQTTLESLRFDEQGRLVKKPPRGPDSPVSDILLGAFTPDGTLIATIETQSGYPVPVVVIRITRTFDRRVATTTYHQPLQLMFSPDGLRLLVRAAASVACYETWNLKQKPRKIVNPSRKHFVSMAVHPEGKLLTVDNDALVRVWDIATLTHVRTVEWNIGKLYAVAASPDGTRAAVGSHTGKVLVWDWD